MLFFYGILNAQENYRFRTDAPQGFSIESSTATELSLHYSVPEIDIAHISNGEIEGHEIIMKGSFGSFAEGLPNLPFENKYIAVPKGATVSVEVKEKGCQTLRGIEVLPAASVQGNAAVGMPKLKKDMSVFGKDANCGRILCALGYAGPDFDPAVIELYLIGEKETLCFYRDGCVQPFDEETAAGILAEKAVRFACDMKNGHEEATAWGCDLTHDYVTINGDYRS